jgi:pimeloyl-ACP methyl ester carboxylesterase
MFIFLYFNSWGGSDAQTKYISDSLLPYTVLFKTFTVSITDYGGFDPTAIPDDYTFDAYIMYLINQLVTRMIKDIRDISNQYPRIPIVCISHSFGYSMLYSCLKQLNVNIHRIILLDPAGKALTENQLILNSILFKRFIQLFKSPFIVDNRYLEWDNYISYSTSGLYTTYEKQTGMYRYIRDCMNANPLDLSIWGYAGDFLNIDLTIKKYANKTYLLTTTNGIAYKNKSYWVKHIPSSHFLVIGNSGHFLHIYNQYNTLWFICKILTIKMYFVRYTSAYNSPMEKSYRNVPILELIRGRHPLSRMIIK